MKTIVYLNPKEFRELLPESLRELYDSLVNSLITNGVEERVAEYLVAKEMLEVLKEEKE